MSEKINTNKGKKIKKFINLPVRYAALKLYTKNNNLEGMYHNLLQLQILYKNKASYYEQLAKLAYRRKKWSLAIEHIDIAIKLANKSSLTSYYQFKINCLFKLENSTKAIECMNAYLSINPQDSKIWKKLGDTQYGLKQWEDAKHSFEIYTDLRPEDVEANFKLAECYREFDELRPAMQYYRLAAENMKYQNQNNIQAHAYYWLGIMQQKNKESENAKHSHSKAIQLDKKLNSKHLGIGAFYEYYNKTEAAIDAYKERLTYTRNNEKLLFKLASILEEQYEEEEAIAYYEQALNLNKIDPDWHYSLAVCYEKLKDYKNASKWYYSAVARKQKHMPEWYRRLGFSLEKSGQENDALLAYQEADLYRRPSGIDKKYYDKHIKSLATRYSINYEYYNVNNKVIFYESMAGSRLMCNPLELFKQLLKDEEFKNYTHVWSIKDPFSIPPEYQNIDNIIFVKRDTDLYMKYVSSAKYIIINSKLPKNLVRKPEQKLLETWHGTAYKTIGGHDYASPLGYKNANKVFLSTTHTLTPNPYMSNIQPECYQFKHVYTGQMAETGYPRIDATINMNFTERKQLADNLGINLDKPVVLYAPTWRGTYSNNVYDVSKLQKDLEKLSKLNVQLIFRGHHLSEKHIKGKLNNIKVVPQSIDSNKLLGVTDLLITDYSSIFFDYLVTDKPIIHYLYDLEEYSKERGLYLSVDELPGEVAYTIEDVEKYINKDLDSVYEPSEKYELAKKRFCPHEDGQVSSRVIDWFIRDKTDQVELINTGDKPTILVYGGDFTPGVKTDEFIKRLKEFDYSKYNIDVIIPTNVAGSKDRMQQFKLLPEEVMILPYMEGMTMTLQERKAIEYYNKYNNFVNTEMKSVYNKAFYREVYRVLGDSNFVQVKDFAKDSNFWDSFLNHVDIKNEVC